MFRVNGKPAIGLAIAMRDGGDILALGRNVKKAIGGIIADLPLGIDATLVSDQPVVVRTAIDEFTKSLWQAIAIIMAVSIISLGFRPGAVVALSIPLTMAIVFPIMEGLGIDLQRISLGALIIALGLLVDDAMTTVDVMTSRLATGDSKEQAATFAYKTLAFPMLTGSFVTAAGFVPIGFAQSAAGEYTFSIFAVVTIALIVSWFVAVLFAPLLGVWLLKKPEGTAPQKQSTDLRIFRGILIGAMRRRWLTIASTLACFAVSLLALAVCAAAIFSAVRPAGTLVDLLCRKTPRSSPATSGRANSTASQRRSRRRELEHLCRPRGDPLLSAAQCATGQRFFFPGRRRRQGRARRGNGSMRSWRDAGGTVAERRRSRFAARSLGRRSAGPCNIGSAGLTCAGALDRFATGSNHGRDPNVRLVNFDWMEPSRKVRIQVDQDQARLFGLSSQALAEVLNTVMTGTPITQVRDNIYLINVVTRAQDEQRVSLSTLRALQLPLPNGRTVPLSQVATFDFEQEFPLIWRRQRVPTLTVQADVASGATPEAAVNSLTPAVGNSMRACRKAIASKSAEPSRKAPNRRLRSSPRCP